MKCAECIQQATNEWEPYEWNKRMNEWTYKRMNERTIKRCEQARQSMTRMMRSALSNVQLWRLYSHVYIHSYTHLYLSIKWIGFERIGAWWRLRVSVHNYSFLSRWLLLIFFVWLNPHAYTHTYIEMNVCICCSISCCFYGFLILLFSCVWCERICKQRKLTVCWRRRRQRRRRTIIIVITTMIIIIR